MAILCSLIRASSPLLVSPTLKSPHSNFGTSNKRTQSRDSKIRYIQCMEGAPHNRMETESNHWQIRKLIRTEIQRSSILVQWITSSSVNPIRKSSSLLIKCKWHSAQDLKVTYLCIGGNHSALKVAKEMEQAQHQYVNLLVQIHFFVETNMTTSTLT